MREQDLRGEYMCKLEDVQRLDRELSSVVDQGKKEILKGELLKKEITKSEAALEAAKMELRETHGEEIDVNLLLAYARSFIQTLEIIWCDAPYAVKKKIQRFVLPGAVSVLHSPSGYIFSNPGINRLFKLIEEVGAAESNVVSLLSQISNTSLIVSFPFTNV